MAKPRNGRGPILIVDDEQALLEMLRDLLTAEGYEVVLARDGMEALEAAKKQRPSLILLDMKMPRMDGWAFAREVRRSGLLVPIIVMTAAPSARQWADEILADDHLAKPFSLDDVIAKVEEHRPRLN